MFESKSHKEIFSKGASQEQNNFLGGHVSINFINKDLKRDEQLEAVLKETLYQIENCRDRGFDDSEMAILVRDNKQSSQISSWLTENNISVLSEDSLSINNSEKIKQLISLIKLKVNSKNQEARTILIRYLTTCNKPTDQFLFYKNNLNNEIENFLENLNISPAFKAFEMPFFESIDLFIKELKMDLKQHGSVHTFFSRNCVRKGFSRKK